jgi:hypothetical protein
MKATVIDNFTVVGEWQAIASGEAVLRIGKEAAEEGHAMRLDFDFKGGGGFVVARKVFNQRLPESFAFSFRVRGAAPANKLEFKLADPSGRNVWRWQKEAFPFASEAEEVWLKSSQIEFAWGPAGGGTLRQLGAIEFVISAGIGGKGTVWIEALKFEDRTLRQAPAVAVSSQAMGSEPESLLRSKPSAGWRSAAQDKRPVLAVDFHGSREYGGLVIDWQPKPALRAFQVQASEDGKKWRTLARLRQAEGARTWVHLPAGESRHLRLVFSTPAAMRNLRVLPFDSTRAPMDFFHTMAADSPRGAHPRWLLREQSYWTCAGVPEGLTCALINEEGLIEPDKGSFALEPFLHVGGSLRTWADAKRRVRMEADGLPIPSAVWTLPECRLTTTAFAVGSGENAILLARYRVENRTAAALKTRLFVAVRPYQVNPPWQAWNGLGGLKPIHALEWKKGVLQVDGGKAVVPLGKPPKFGAMTFEQGSLTEHLAVGSIPGAARVRDPAGYASGVFQFDLRLPAGSQRDVFVAVPFASMPELTGARLREIAKLDGATQFESALEVMRRRLGGLCFDFPAGLPRAAADTFRSAAGQILINRDGPALQPGPRRYTRSWIRDGVIMGAALMRIGDVKALPEFIRWFAPYQRKDGFVPCCVDRAGPDWLVEHDSHGQLIFGVMESFRFTGDRDFLKALWPRIRKAAVFMESLIASRLTPEYARGTKRACRGLLPESASHEGYLAHPVHSYWDDFWALRGFRDAAAAAAQLGHADDDKRFAKAARLLQRHLTESIQRVVQTKKLAYVPGSVEWADFDPTATSNAIALLQGLDCMPPAQVESMYATFVHDFRRKHRGEMPWNNYTAYEIRIIGALVRLGKRAEALELLAFFLSDRRPLRWNQWPEITWKEPRSPGHLGDVPHTWIASEYMLVFTSLFAYERESDDSLVIGAGVDKAWLAARRGLAIEGLPTSHGRLNLTMKQSGPDALQVSLAGALALPVGGFIIQPPTDQPIRSVSVNGADVTTFNDREAVVREFPATVEIRFQPTLRGGRSIRVR